MGKKGTGIVTKKCQECEKIFQCRHDRPGKFCSRSCSSKNKPQKSFRYTFSCKCCGKNAVAKRYRKNTAKYCSRKCLSIVRGLSMRKENHPKWRGGISERSYEDRLLIENKKKEIGRCEVCGIEKNLEGHHINGYGNDKMSIQILCVECHANKHPRYARFIRNKYGRKMDK